MVIVHRYTFEEYKQEDYKKLNRIYIAGPIDNLPYDFAKKRFEKTQKRLNSARFLVLFNPTKVCDKDWENEVCMRVCIANLVECQAIYLQRFWWLSRGARLERKIAIACGMDLIYE